MDEVLDVTVMSHFCCLQSKLLYVFITEGTSKNLKKKKVLLPSCQKLNRKLRGGATVLQWKCIQFLLRVKMNNEIKCIFSKT